VGDRRKDRHRRLFKRRKCKYCQLVDRGRLIKWRSNGGINPAIQQGTSNSNQTITITQQQHESIIGAIRQIKKIVHQQRESIPDKKREGLERKIALAEDELKTKKPKLKQLKGYLTSIKNIAEGTGIAVSLVPKIVPILDNLRC
jgi:hypothetical protein